MKNFEYKEQRNKLFKSGIFKVLALLISIIVAFVCYNIDCWGGFIKWGGVSISLIGTIYFSISVVFEIVSINNFNYIDNSNSSVVNVNTSNGDINMASIGRDLLNDGKESEINTGNSNLRNGLNSDIGKQNLNKDSNLGKETNKTEQLIKVQQGSVRGSNLKTSVVSKEELTRNNVEKYIRDKNRFIWHVKFPYPFKNTPIVQLSISQMDQTAFVRNFYKDLNSERYIPDAVSRYKLEALDVKNTGMRIELSSWNSENIFYGAQVNWLAIESKE